MQTFLPHLSFIQSAECLDTKRLGKQRVESKQILLALGFDVGEHRGNSMSRWRHHPAVRLWRGYEWWLARYSVEVCLAWRARGYRDSLVSQFQDVSERIAELRGPGPAPHWLGMKEFHASHRSNLLRKLPDYYSRFGWSEPSDLPYVWPV